MGVGNNNFKSDSIEYETPQILFDKLDKEFNFNLDVCASDQNYKCKKYYTKEDDCFTKEWMGNCWMNPPFSRNLSKFVLKMHDEYNKNGGIKVCLIPVRSNTVWWSKIIHDAECRFINGEVNFNNEKNGLWLPMCILVFGNGKKGTCSIINYREMLKNSN